MRDDYLVAATKPRELVKRINSGRFRCCEMYAYIRNNLVVVKQIEGNCVDTLDDILDEFPGSMYYVPEIVLDRLFKEVKELSSKYDRVRFKISRTIFGDPVNVDVIEGKVNGNGETSVFNPTRDGFHPTVKDNLLHRITYGFYIELTGEGRIKCP